VPGNYSYGLPWYCPGSIIFKTYARLSLKGTLGDDFEINVIGAVNRYSKDLDVVKKKRNALGIYSLVR